MNNNQPQERNTAYPRWKSINLPDDVPNGDWAYDDPPEYILRGHMDGTRGSLFIEKVTYKNMWEVSRQYDTAEYLEETDFALMSTVDGNNQMRHLIKMVEGRIRHFANYDNTKWVCQVLEGVKAKAESLMKPTEETKPVVLDYHKIIDKHNGNKGVPGWVLNAFQEYSNQFKGNPSIQQISDAWDAAIKAAANKSGMHASSVLTLLNVSESKNSVKETYLQSLISK